LHIVFWVFLLNVNLHVCVWFFGGWVWVFWAKQRPIIFSCRPWGTAAAVKEEEEEEEEEVFQAQ
jgi:hypothetical protein